MESHNISINRKARYNYEILETYEAGLVLTGTEIKSIRSGNANMADAYAHADGGELWLRNLHIAHYAASSSNHHPTRTRKLLLRRSQIIELTHNIGARGLTVVPLKLYLKNGLAKIELALARGKKRYDKRQTIIERDRKREADRAIKNRRI
ncbi:MAG: SsrA-binding protein SmpB [Dehalococcoidia bacterium]|jgi:SsrA-binding protein|nr:SsrA-binding protein [Chloroflexota bacterium]|tara:strand:- start:4862 stop:5314 length:453 start_codon:yes stop_codon:yes gene_type:complete